MKVLKSLLEQKKNAVVVVIVVDVVVVAITGSFVCLSNIAPTIKLLQSKSNFFQAITTMKRSH